MAKKKKSKKPKTPAQIRATKEYEKRKEAGETDSAILADLDETRDPDDDSTTVSEERVAGVTYDQADEAQKKSKKKG